MVNSAGYLLRLFQADPSRSDKVARIDQQLLDFVRWHAHVSSVKAFSFSGRSVTAEYFSWAAILLYTAANCWLSEVPAGDTHAASSSVLCTRSLSLSNSDRTILSTVLAST
jgi:hypothetical protein